MRTDRTYISRSRPGKQLVVSKRGPTWPCPGSHPRGCPSAHLRTFDVMRPQRRRPRRGCHSLSSSRTATFTGDFGTRLSYHPHPAPAALLGDVNEHAPGPPSTLASQPLTSALPALISLLLEHTRSWPRPRRCGLWTPAPPHGRLLLQFLQGSQALAVRPNSASSTLERAPRPRSSQFLSVLPP